MKTSRQQTLLLSGEELTYLPADSPANLSALQGEERERMMTVTSGMKCYEQYAKSNPLGLWLKMCMESHRWYSPARRLLWDAKQLSLKKITFTEKSNSTLSNKSVRTLRMQNIQSNRLLFRLVPSVRHTVETGCGLLPTVQTQVLKICNEKGKTAFMPMEMLPTPTSIDCGSGRVNKSKSPNASSRPTIARLATMNLLPTPRAQDGQDGPNKVINGAVHRPSGQIFSAGLRDLAGNQLLPTPKAQESRGNASSDRGKRNSTDEIAKRYHPTGSTSQLNPLFVAEMMGFPVNWTLSPFLVGEKNL